jgi:rod shape-determining protein MreC
MVQEQAAQILYESPDPYSRKVVVDRGSAQGVALASPVVNEAGVLGQVTRVYLSSSEVTLLTDKDAAIPVLNARTQARSAAFGGTAALGAAMELRFMAGNADVQIGDTLVTSGVDGIYPPGLSVARVVSVDRKADTGFARIFLAPVAKADGVRHVLLLQPIGLQMPARPEAAADAASKPAGKRGSRR